ncbi:MAG: molybdopterin-dependent oxidoreductase [Bryobacteraceae bacterium]
MNDRKKTPEQELAVHTRRAFLTMGVAAAAGYGSWRWLRSRPEVEGLAQPFRRMLHFNETVARAYGQSRLAPVFPPGSIQKIRVNGDIGLGDAFDPGKWHLTIKPLTGAGQIRRVTVADIQALPKVEHITQLKCIEGWSVVTHWTGARFSDFTAKFAPESVHAPYVSMQTPDEEYFVGLDMPSALHPQTLLCYEMNGAPLAMENGAPLRLAIPVKYGIKNIKRISTITYTQQRPDDYWAQEGYDWYAGL